jgi:hypothetical protein
MHCTLITPSPPPPSLPLPLLLLQLQNVVATTSAEPALVVKGAIDLIH